MHDIRLNFVISHNAKPGCNKVDPYTVGEHLKIEKRVGTDLSRPHEVGDGLDGGKNEQ